MTQVPGLPWGAVPVVGPAESWTPPQDPGPTQDPGGRSGQHPRATPDPLRPSGTIQVPCDDCEGTGSRLHERTSGPPGTGPCMPCKGNGVIEVVWRVSPYDRHAHAFYTPGGGGPSAAPRPCRHSVPTGRLSDDVDGAPKCVMCLIVVGDAMANCVERDVSARLEQLGAEAREDPIWDVYGPREASHGDRPRE